MTVMPIVTWPDRRLREVCLPVGAITGETRALAADMLETMYAAPGRGLAASQVGVMQRLFVTDVSWKEGERAPQVFVNPRFLEISDTLVEMDEGCLSIPGVMTSVERPDRVHVAWTSLKGAPMDEVFTGFAAACVQHEMDHLNGVVTLDHLPPQERARVEAEYAA